jgi:protein-S-isoprenylcysteine O-methyltransferase Ste14
MADTIFKIIYLIEFLIISAVRVRYTSRYRALEIRVARTKPIDAALLGLIGLGMLIPLVYMFTDWLEFADYLSPNWVGWLGAVLFAGAIVLLWRSHAELGRNWTPTLGFRDEHTLITDGVYRYIRHPMYAAHLLWGIAQAMMLHNWIAGLSLVVPVLPQYLLRVEDEEAMMIERFGTEYREYMQRTGRVLPRLRASSRRPPTRGMGSAGDRPRNQ